MAPLSTVQIGIHNVTFEPRCRNNWHIHHATNGGGQILVCVAGKDIVNIPAGVKNWHGAE